MSEFIPQGKNGLKVKCNEKNQICMVRCTGNRTFKKQSGTSDSTILH